MLFPDTRTLAQTQDPEITFDFNRHEFNKPYSNSNFKFRMLRPTPFKLPPLNLITGWRQETLLMGFLNIPDPLFCTATRSPT